MSLDTNAPSLIDHMDEILRHCIHCGLCLSACPSYYVIRAETDSPRGRIAMTNAVYHDRVQVDAGFIENIERCLACFACVSACPSEVDYNHILNLAHLDATQARPPQGSERLARWLALRQLLPHVNRLRLLAWLGSLYQRLGLPFLARKVLPFFPRFFQTAEGLLPEKPFQPRTHASNHHSSEKKGMRVGLFTGCIQEAFLGKVNQATVRVLERNGFEVVIPPGQTCCGALPMHLSEEKVAVDLAKQNVRAFLDAGVEAIICNAGGCGAAMLDYPELLQNDPHYASLANEFCAKLRDISAFLVEQQVKPPCAQLSMRVTYADSCHLRNVQKVSAPPRAVLRSIPGVELVELEHLDRCCGSAGVYNLLHADIAAPLLDDKLRDIKASGAEVILAANPGCQLQIQAGVRRTGLPVRVLHVVELLDEAYRMEAK